MAVMNNEWKNYLLQNGATQVDEGLFIFDESFADALIAEDSNVICDLSHFSTVVVAGGDAAEFMQGQFTNDVDKVDDHHSQLSAFCNNKGRMVANFRLFRYQQNYFINMRQDLVDKSLEHLQNYILRAQVAIQDVSEQLVHIGISGKDAESIVGDFIENPGTDADSLSQNEDYIAIRAAGSVPRYEIFCSADKAMAFWQGVSEKASTVNSDYWDLLNIRSGIPFIDSNTSEEFVPQMANMELINGVSFEKGCYTGQEIVARTHYLGKQKRRTYHIGIDTDTKPKPGEQLATETSTENQYTGTLVTVYQMAESAYEALAVIQIKAAEQEKLLMKNADAEVSLLKLPYSLEESA